MIEKWEIIIPQEFHALHQFTLTRLDAKEENFKDLTDRQVQSLLCNKVT
jgi:hypothetical protein